MYAPRGGQDEPHLRIFPHQILETLKVTKFEFGAYAFRMQDSIEIKKEVEIFEHSDINLIASSIVSSNILLLA